MEWRRVVAGGLGPDFEVWNRTRPSRWSSYSTRRTPQFRRFGLGGPGGRRHHSPAPRFARLFNHSRSGRVRAAVAPTVLVFAGFAFSPVSL
jgi:hypothetical protein